MLVIKFCSACNSEFNSIKDSVIMCKKCRRRHPIPSSICEWCGVVFTLSKNRKHNTDVCPACSNYLINECEVTKALTKEYMKQYAIDNKEKLKEARRIYRLAHLDREKFLNKKWAKENAEKLKLRSAAYYKRNSHKIKDRVCLWLKNHPKVAAERTKKRYAKLRTNNPEILKNYVNARRARLARADGVTTTQDIEFLLSSCEGICAYCGAFLEGVYHIDHIVPLSKGGSNWPENIQILCPKCNLTKSNKDPIIHEETIGIIRPDGFYNNDRLYTKSK